MENTMQRDPLNRADMDADLAELMQHSSIGQMLQRAETAADEDASQLEEVGACWPCACAR